MAVLNCDFFSEVLNLSTTIKVILPQIPVDCPDSKTVKKFRKKPSVLYLLHGYSGDHNCWLNNSLILRYLDKLNLAVIMPAANNSIYSNMINNFDYWTYISEELPLIAKRFFNISAKPEKTFVAGLSMGGYGAFKLAFSFPDRFAAAGSFSGVLDIKSYYKNLKRNTKERLDIERVFGDMDFFQGSNNDLFHLLNRQKNNKCNIPKLFQCCGTEDVLYPGNINFKKHLEKNDIPFMYEEGPGEHDWDYWNESIKKFITFIRNLNIITEIT
jgi:putative tributyrin esterase